MDTLKTAYNRNKRSRRMGKMIPLVEWARLHGITPDTARQRANRGAFETAEKQGRDWFIDSEEDLVDHRRRESK